MAAVPDETLMAYADGELDEAERAAVEAVLKRDAQSRARLAIFLRTSHREVGRLFDGILHEPVPHDLIAAVDASEQQRQRRPVHARAPTAGFVDVLAGLFSSWPAMAAYAASIAIAAGAAWTLKPTSRPAETAARVQTGGSIASAAAGPAQVIAIKDGHIQAGGVLRRALETLPSRSRAEAASDGGEQAATVTVRLSYRSPTNAYCRQYELRLASGESFAGIGCRTAEGTWQVPSHVQVAPDATAGGQKTAPASGVVPPEIASIVQRTGQVLSEGEEQAALAARWQSQPH